MPLRFNSAKERISHAKLRETLDYNPETGWLTWKVKRQKVKIGSRAGSVKKGTNGDYRQINVEAHVYNEHRLIWFWWFGVWPDHEIDHKDLNGTNNRIANLRPATRVDNLMNTSVRRSNALGIKGVRATPNGRYSAALTVNGKQKYLGTFETPEAASAAFKNAVFSRNPEFARAS